MDKKISEFAAATGLNAVDLIPIVSAGGNKSITAGMFAANLPNVGNKGTTKNTVVSATVASIMVSASTLVRLTLSAHILQDGGDGQQVKLFSTIPSTLTFATPGIYTQISFIANGFVTLRFVGGVGWIVESNNSAVTIS